MKVRNTKFRSSERRTERIIEYINSIQISVLQVRKQLSTIEDILTNIENNMKDDKNEVKDKTNQWLKSLPPQ